MRFSKLYSREDGPLYRYTPRPGYRRTVTVPSGVGPHVRLVFSEMARTRRTYDEVEAASGIRRPTVKAWRHKNAPGLESLESVLNCLGFHFIAVPAHVEVLPPTVAAKVAEVAALAQKQMGEVFSAAVQIAARQLVASEESARILAEIDAARQTPKSNSRRRKRKPPANDNQRDQSAVA
jgi:hypothetical protein